MKNWKKLLACLLVGLMALTVFTACDASVGAPMGPEHSNAESKSVKALRDRFKVSYSEELRATKPIPSQAGSPALSRPAKRARTNFIAGPM